MSDPAGHGGGPAAVHQFVPALIPRDATGSHTLLLRRALRAAGWRSEIFAEATHDELAGESRPIAAYEDAARPDDVLVYQFSTSSMVAEYLLGRSERLVLDYHNVTRPELYGAWDPDGARRSAEAFEQLGRLAPRACLGLADSAFNEEDLRRAGCRRTAVVPVLVDVQRLGAAPDRRVLAHLSAKGDGADWLFVGRLVPSKAQHRLVEALWAARRLYDPHARLHLVGPAPTPRYVAALRDLVDDLGLTGAVHLVGEVSDDALAAYFAAADVYVSLSVHEGFGVPLLEAMAAGVPVVARRAGAVPATVAGAGLVLDGDDPGTVAAAVHRVLDDPALRARLVAAGRARAAELSLADGGARAVAAIASVAGAPR
ncbi:MAG: glycosyltransferase family 4 protein [Acidimicrobiales bacterium]